MGGKSHVLSLDATIRNNAEDAVETEPIDLLLDRIFYYADIPMTANKEIDKNALLDAACDALREKSDALGPYIQR